MNDILFANIKKARMEAQKEVISENMMGIDFTTLLYESEPLVELVRWNSRKVNGNAVRIYYSS